MPLDLSLKSLDITPDDRDAQAIFDSALSAAQLALPDWTPRNGNVEVILMEAMSIAAADAIYALNRIPPIVLESVLALYGIIRSTGDQAVGTVTVDFDDLRTLEIAAGTEFADTVTGLTMYARDDTQVTNLDTITITVVATDAGAAGNEIEAGSDLDIVDSIPYSIGATVATGLTGGTDPENDEAYFDRASTVLARVTSSLVIPSHFIAYALQDTRVLRATAIDLFEPGGTPGSDLGHITIYVYGRGGQVAEATRTEIETAMQTLSAAMITVHVEPATVITQAVDITVVGFPGYSTEAIAADVETAIANYLSTDTWVWGADVIVNELIAVASAVPGVDYVQTVGTPSGTVTVAANELVDGGTITVSVI